MEDDRIAGGVPGGQGGEGVSKVAGHPGAAVQGPFDQAAGAVQYAYGRTRDAAVQGASSVKDAVVGGHDVVAKFMEDNPHTTAIIALGLGLLIGYAAQRPTSPSRWWK